MALPLRSYSRLLSLSDFLCTQRSLGIALQRTLSTLAAGAHPSAADADSVLDDDGLALLPSQSLAVPLEEQLLLQATVVGAPNAGKSTLVNALVGSKVSAVSAKTNTTVRSVLGALTVGAAQVVLFDTPGVVASANYKTPVHERRVQSAWRVARDADLLMFLVDAQRQLQRPDPRVLAVVEDYGRRVAAAEALAAQETEAAAEADAARVQQQEIEQQQQQERQNVDGIDSTSEQQQQQEQQQRRQEAVHAKALAAATDESWPPAVLLLNKVDAIPRDKRPALLPLAQQFCDLAKFDDVFYISALHGQGLGQLREYLLGRATPGQWTLEDPAAATDASLSQQAEEVVREKLFRRLYKELPYRLSLRTESLNELDDGTLRIEMEILAPTNGARKIIVGRQGAVIGALGMEARKELAEQWGRTVHLILNVRVAKDK